MGILDDAIREHLELKRRHGADSGEVSRQEREILGADGAPAPEQAYDDDASVEPVAYAEPEPAPVAEPLAGSPLAEPEPAPAAPPVVAPDLFPGTNELMAAASQTSPTPTPAPATPAAAAPLRPPAPADADSETAARSGARRLSDDELAAWRRRLSERADRLAAQRPGTGAPGPATAAGAAASTPAPATPPPAQSEPPAYWSGNTASADAGTPPATPSLGKPAPAVEPTAPGVPADFFDAGDAEDAFSPEPAPEPVAADAADHDVLDDTPDFLEETPEHDRMWFEQKPPRDFDFG